MNAFEVINEHKTKYILIPFSKVDRVDLNKMRSGGYELQVFYNGDSFFIMVDNGLSLYQDYRNWLWR